jgi:MiaB-like tRNA modifying enzyme
MKYLISTLGCKVNQYETQAIETLLQSHGHVPVQKGERADAVIINTCAVTAESGRKSRQVIRRLREENPGCLTAVCGCYSQLSPEDVADLGGNVIFGTNDKHKFVETIEKAVDSDDNFLKIDKPFERREFEKLPAGAVSGRTRALLKIQDGCVNFCSYCIIPYTRGRLRSLPIEEAVEETIKIREDGYKELVITGIEIASYGVDLEGKPALQDVICACAENAGDMRLRLGSLEPRVITEDFCQKLSAHGNICRHFHLALQSGCDETLKAMNRKYDTARFYESCRLLREYFPGCGITCDMITGFPGETEENFESTLEFIRKCAFSNMHIFPYSRRPGTPADKMPDQCSNKVKAERSARAIKVAEEMHQSFLAQSVGKTLPVLFETYENGVWTGHSDTYVLVRSAGENLRNKVIDVKITGIEKDCLIGELC